MAGEDEAREGGENAQRSESPAFGRRSAAAPSSSGKLAKVAAAAGRAEYVLRAAADLKPQGLSWGLVLCVAATVALGVLALINRPQIDDDAAYYVVAGVLIFAALMADRFGLFTARRPILLSIVTLVGVISFGPLVEGYWYAWAQYWKQSGPWPNPADPTIEDLLAFDHPWCTAWTDKRWFCRTRAESADFEEFVAMQPQGTWDERSSARARCWQRRNGEGNSIRRVSCGSHSIPRWCILWWTGTLPFPNPSPNSLSLEEYYSGTPGPGLPPEHRYPGQCMKTKWD